MPPQMVCDWMANELIDWLLTDIVHQLDTASFRLAEHLVANELSLSGVSGTTSYSCNDAGDCHEPIMTLPSANSTMVLTGKTGHTRSHEESILAAINRPLGNVDPFKTQGIFENVGLSISLNPDASVNIVDADEVKTAGRSTVSSSTLQESTTSPVYDSDHFESISTTGISGHWADKAASSCKSDNGGRTVNHDDGAANEEGYANSSEDDANELSASDGRSLGDIIS
ncbi:unnamed protein product, partial [Protopolystoma xenopodis]